MRLHQWAPPLGMAPLCWPVKIVHKRHAVADAFGPLWRLAFLLSRRFGQRVICARVRGTTDPVAPDTIFSFLSLPGSMIFLEERHHLSLSFLFLFVQSSSHHSFLFLVKKKTREKGAPGALATATKALGSSGEKNLFSLTFVHAVSRPRAPLVGG
nr:hypothetical protein [Pandoravirus massiliensis]